MKKVVEDKKQKKQQPEIAVSYNKEEAELVLLGMLEIRDKLTSLGEGEMKEDDYNRLIDTYDSLIEKIKIPYQAAFPYADAELEKMNVFRNNKFLGFCIAFAIDYPELEDATYTSSTDPSIVIEKADTGTGVCRVSSTTGVVQMSNNLNHLSISCRIYLLAFSFIRRQFDTDLDADKKVIELLSFVDECDIKEALAQMIGLISRVETPSNLERAKFYAQYL